MGYLLHRGIYIGDEDKNEEMGEGLYSVFYRFVYMDTPGIGKQTFYIKFDKDMFRKGDIIGSGSMSMEVIKVYRRTWWRRVLLWMGFRVRMMQVKVRPKE
jgi:hypothetical protein